MPSTVTIPGELLELMDVQAKARGLSRDRFIIEVLRRSCGAEAAKAAGPGLSRLERAAEARQAAEDLAVAMRRRRGVEAPSS